MIEIPLVGKYSDEVVIFDDDQEMWVKSLKWYCSKPPRSKTMYAKALVHSGHSRKQSIFAHHWVIGVPPKGFVTDHINGNGLDNRKTNLRHITQSENMKAAFERLGDSYPRYKGKRDGIRTTIKYLADGTPKTYFYDRKTGKRLSEEEALKRFGNDLPERTKAGLQKL